MHIPVCTVSLPQAINCADWASRGLNQSCIADVDPDGEQPLLGSVKVECDFDTEPGKAVTVIRKFASSWRDLCINRYMSYIYITVSLPDRYHVRTRCLVY